MTAQATFRLSTMEARQNACRAIVAAPEGYVVEIKEPTRNLLQNAALHAALMDIARQVKWHGKDLSVDVWKRLCTAAWLREVGESPEMIPALDGKGFDIVFERTSTMSVAQMSRLIDWVMCFGAQNGVKFKAPSDIEDWAGRGRQTSSRP